MQQFAGALKKGVAAKFKRKSGPYTDAIFTLFSTGTVGVFLTCSVMVTLTNLIGKPITCNVDESFKQYTPAINTYCWITSTFSVQKHFDKPLDEVVYPGIGPFNVKEDAIVRHTYYQWVTFVLIFQAVSFYIPRFIWKRIEGNRVNNLITGCGAAALTGKVDNELKHRMGLLITYINDHGHYNTFIYYTYVFCEVLNVLICVINIFLTDAFVGHEFTTYGINVVRHMRDDPEIRTDPMSQVFPYLTKCSFPFFGPSGTIMIIDSLCVMAQNIINEKIYFFLWFYLLILVVFGTFGLLHRFAVTLLSYLREKKFTTLIQKKHRRSLHYVLKKCYVGDWFLLYQIAKKMGPVLFGLFVEELHREWDGEHDFEDTEINTSSV